MLTMRCHLFVGEQYRHVLMNESEPTDVPKMSIKTCIVVLECAGSMFKEAIVNGSRVPLNKTQQHCQLLVD